jgi:2-methylisocitrate lyase-like PEP mutase family enzyme
VLFFPAVTTGAGTAATLGDPDYGLVTMSEMAENASRIASAVDVPVIADADTGYAQLRLARRLARQSVQTTLYRCVRGL